MALFFKRRTSPHPSAPAPNNETPQYERFDDVYVKVSFATFIIAAYATYFIFGARLDAVATWLAREFPLLAPRIEFLRAWDAQSVRAYAATMVSGALLFPIFLLINAIGYWKNVVRIGGCNPVDAMTFKLLIQLLVMFGGLTVIAVFFIPSTWNPRYPGMTRIFFWPAFPALGGLMWALDCYIFFYVPVAILKYVFRKRLNNE